MIRARIKAADDPIDYTNVMNTSELERIDRTIAEANNIAESSSRDSYRDIRNPWHINWPDVEIPLMYMQIDAIFDIEFCGGIHTRYFKGVIHGGSRDYINEYARHMDYRSVVVCADTGAIVFNIAAETIIIPKYSRRTWHTDDGRTIIRVTPLADRSEHPDWRELVWYNPGEYEDSEEIREEDIGEAFDELFGEGAG